MNGKKIITILYEYENIIKKNAKDGRVSCLILCVCVFDFDLRLETLCSFAMGLLSSEQYKVVRQ